MSIAGIIIGLLGTIIPIIVFIVFGATILAMCGLASVGISMAENQLASQDAADAITSYYEQNGQLPDDATAAILLASFAHEGSNFRYKSGVGDSGFHIEHPGPDGKWDTPDDWQTTWDAVWDNDATNDYEATGADSGDTSDDDGANDRSDQDDHE